MTRFEIIDNSHSEKRESFMDCFTKSFVHLTIDAVDFVVSDPEGHYDAEQYDRYASFTEARDAALSSIEIMLDEEDYDGADHREELERMLGILESSSTYEEMENHPDYRSVLESLAPAQSVAA
jgi:hypothetical protein